jgi:hypothetical protein
LAKALKENGEPASRHKLRSAHFRAKEQKSHEAGETPALPSFSRKRDHGARELAAMSAHYARRLNFDFDQATPAHREADSIGSMHAFLA